MKRYAAVKVPGPVSPQGRTLGRAGAAAAPVSGAPAARLGLWFWLFQGSP